MDGPDTQGSGLRGGSENHPYADETLRHEDTGRILEVPDEDATEKEKIRSPPDINDETEKFPDRPFLSTEIPSLFSQNDSRDDRPLLNMLRATSGRGGAVSRQFFPSSDFAPLSVTNRSAHGT